MDLSLFCYRDVLYVIYERYYETAFYETILLLWANHSVTLLLPGYLPHQLRYTFTLPLPKAISYRLH